MQEVIKRKLRLQSLYQWIGYLVAGGVGAVITLIFSEPSVLKQLNLS